MQGRGLDEHGLGRPYSSRVVSVFGLIGLIALMAWMDVKAYVIVHSPEHRPLWGRMLVPTSDAVRRHHVHELQMLAVL